MKSIFVIFCAVLLIGCTSTSRTALPANAAVIQLQPVPRMSVLEETGYIVWGASMVQDEKGTCHLFYCRWKGGLGDWCRGAEIVHATASSPLGPYKPRKVVLGPTAEGADAWDGLSVFNPTVMRFGKKYYLYYTGSNGSNFPIRQKDGSFKTSPNGTLITQRIGVAFADHPGGPWEHMKEPLIDLSKDGIDSHMCCNPTVAHGSDGRFVMIYKCSNGRPNTPEGGIYLTVAFAGSPTGPFEKTGVKIFTSEKSRFPGEDPFLWWQDGRYRCVLDDQRGDFSGAKGLVLFESRDALNWERSTPFVLSRCQIAWEGGEVEKTLHFERPQIWLKDGEPAMLFVAIAKGKQYFNLHVPLQSYESNVSEEKSNKPNAGDGK